MDDYRRMSTRGSRAGKSRSVDFSDLSFFPPKHPSIASTPQPERPPPAADPIRPFPDEDGAGEKFGEILSRSFSSAPQRFRAAGERSRAPAGSLQAAVRRAFSTRRSSSVSEGYRRIHDTAEDDGDGDVEPEVTARQPPPETAPPRKKKAKILRACKRIFGF